MRFDILSVFPEMIRPALTESILGRACSKGILEINLHNIRDYTTDKHRRTDDTPYGGGWGMVMTCQPIIDCHKAVVGEDKDLLTVYMSPSGKVLNQKLAMKLAKQKRIVIICGHYEGIDQRIIDKIVDEEISIGDYVLTGGEIPAMVLIDSVSRYIEGVINFESTSEESFSKGLLEYPQYTRPENFLGIQVPEILKSGHHENIEKWRRKEAIKTTYIKRPELLKKAKLTDEEIEYVKELRNKKD